MPFCSDFAASIAKKLAPKVKTGFPVQTRTEVFYYLSCREGGEFCRPQIALASGKRIEKRAREHVSGAIGIDRLDGFSGNAMQVLAVPGDCALCAKCNNKAPGDRLDGVDVLV